MIKNKYNVNDHSIDIAKPIDSYQDKNYDIYKNKYYKYKNKYLDLKNKISNLKN